MVPLSEELRMVPDVPTDTNLLFAKVTPQRLLDVEEMIVPEAPTATNFPPEEEEEVVVSSSADNGTNWDNATTDNSTNNRCY